MDADAKRLIQHECRDLVQALAQHSDHHEHEKAVAIFTEDGTWIRGGKTFTGQAQLRASFTGSPTEYDRHFTSNIMITVDDADHATGVTYYILYRFDPGTPAPKLPMPLMRPFSLGEWHDRFVRTPAGWRIAHREVRRLMQRQD